MIISVVANQTGVKKFKAPQHTMYVIYGIQFSVFTTGNTTLAVAPYLYEDERVSFGLEESDLIAVMSMELEHSVHFPFIKGERTKYFTIVPQGSTAFQCIVSVHYELEKATKVDLIWEWFRKGR